MKSKQRKTQQSKTTLVWLPSTTLGQETRWPYCTMLPSPQAAREEKGEERKHGREKEGKEKR